jgi:hypothetical protein
MAKKKKNSRASTEDKVAIGAGLGCIGFLVLVKLAFIALIAWGIFELVSWVTTK